MKYYQSYHSTNIKSFWNIIRDLDWTLAPCITFRYDDKILFNLHDKLYIKVCPTAKFNSNRLYKKISYRFFKETFKLNPPYNLIFNVEL